MILWREAPVLYIVSTEKERKLRCFFYVTGFQLFVESLRASFPCIDLRRVYSVNVKADVVRRSLELGVVRAEQQCACDFVEVHAEAVRSFGGFRFCMHLKRD